MVCLLFWIEVSVWFVISGLLWVGTIQLFSLCRVLRRVCVEILSELCFFPVCVDFYFWGLFGTRVCVWV